MTDEQRAREVLAYQLEADGFLVSARKLRAKGNMPNGWLFASSIRAMLAFAQPATPAEGEELSALREALTNLRDACLLADAKEELSYDIDGSLLDSATEALELQYPVIWSAEQVEMLKRRQADPVSHPYTCGNDRSDAAHVAMAEEEYEEPGLLYPTRRGWKCPACDYRQFWSHETGGPSSLRALPAPVASQGVGESECHGLDTPERICFYEQDFYVLSNFSAFTLYWNAAENIRFDTSEAAYHWEKFHGYDDIQFDIINAVSAHEAFKIANEYKQFRRPDWDDVKVDIMRDILRAKANQHEYVSRKLLATGDRELVENSWRDDYWGWGPNRDGQNMLGKLWMEVRDELRAALSPPSSPVDGEKGA